MSRENKNTYFSTVIKGAFSATQPQPFLSQPLAEIIASLEAINSTNKIPLLRNAVLAGRQYQQSLNLITLDVAHAILEWASFIDQILRHAWSAMDWPSHHAADIALLAVGGYGRGELHPYSDIDILILIKNEPTPEVTATIEKFLTLAWDIKLEVGHSVRNIKQCISAAQSDITIATNLIEMRLIAGSDLLFSHLKHETGPEHIWPAADFFNAKKKEQHLRHKKYNHTEYNLEPDIKNAPGGLRDFQTIGWITKRYFQLDSSDDAIAKLLLTKEELALLEKSKLFLWKIRFALHLFSERDENRLLFDHQKELARQLGYQDGDANLAVESFMQQYYRYAMKVSDLNDLILQLFHELIIEDKNKTVVIPIDDNFQIRNSFIEAIHSDVFSKKPSALLEIFVTLANSPEIAGIRASTLRLIRNNAHLVDEHFRKKPRNNALFIQLLRGPHRLFTQLQRMNRSGILGRYIPTFNAIVGQMQYDLFHIYTVDAHTLLVIKNMRRFRYPELKHEFPLASEIATRYLPKIELLYLAGLFHDIGKGRGGDHSEIGAKDAKQFCQAHSLSSWDTRLVSWLVKYHLLMSMTAQKKDVSDPDVINDFAIQVGDQVTLDYLYVLTVADIRATNPNLWNNWRASLLQQLYVETKRALRRGLENPINKEEWIKETKGKALSLLYSQNISPEDVEPIWNPIADDYFVRESAEDIAWHTKAILDYTHNSTDTPSADNPPLILIKTSGSKAHENATQIFVYTEDQPNLFAKTVITLDQLGLSIHDARIMTSFSNFSLDTYIVLDRKNKPLSLDTLSIDAIRETLTTAIQEKSFDSTPTERLTPRRLKSFNVRTEIFISNQPDRSNTIIEIRTLDRAGILATIARVFHQFKLFINSARIATLGESAEDVFFVTDASRNGITDPNTCMALQTALHKAIESLTNNETASTNTTIEF